MIYPILDVLGWVPFGAVWAILIYSFQYSVSSAPAGGGPPRFVYIIVYGQFFSFLTFCVTQLSLLLFDNSAGNYWAGEFSYLCLSFASKGFLGITLLASVIAFDSLEEAVSVAQAEENR